MHNAHLKIQSLFVSHAHQRNWLCVAKEVVLCVKSAGTCEKSKSTLILILVNFIELFNFMLVNLLIRRAWKVINYVGPFENGFVMNFRFRHCVTVKKAKKCGQLQWISSLKQFWPTNNKANDWIQNSWDTHSRFHFA
jgi:hypothetical protein